jgi:hypothetical protein
MPDPAPSGRRFRVALSFAGAQRAFIEQVADQLAETFGKDRVFFYPWFEHETNTVGSLALQVPDFYLSQSDLTVPFISEAYAQSKPCLAEWRSVVELIYTWQGRRLMLFRFDQTPIQGLHSYDCYSEVGGRSAADVADLIARRWALNHGPVSGAASVDTPDRAFDALKEMVGERVLERLKTPALKRLRDDGGLIAGMGESTGPDDLESLVDSLHRATKKCIPMWKQDIAKSGDPLRGAIIEDCRLLLGELLKLGVSKDLLTSQFGDVVSAPPERLCLSCRLVGTAVAIYCALRDLPLRFSSVVDEGFDVSDQAVVSLEGLASGVGSDAAADVFDALRLKVWDELWARVRDRPTAGIQWSADKRNQLRAFIATHWRRDRKWYMLTTETPANASLSPVYDQIAKDMHIGLVVRTAAEQQDMLKIGEENLVALVCEYLELLETL